MFVNKGIFFVCVLFLTVHGNWGDWGDWSQCSATCGGQQQRQRLCNNPAPLHGGNNCSGEGTETQSCGETLCAGLA